MRAIGESILSSLKSATIMHRKPNLKVCSNHRKDKWPRILRWWNSKERGQAVSDNRGWYTYPN